MCRFVTVKWPLLKNSYAVENTLEIRLERVSLVLGSHPMVMRCTVQRNDFGYPANSGCGQRQALTWVWVVWRQVASVATLHVGKPCSLEIF